MGDLLPLASGEALEGRLEALPVRVEGRVSLVHADSLKPEPLTRLDLPDAPDVEGTHGRDLRVASGGLPIHEQDNGLPVAYYLDATERDAVGDDVVALRVLDPRSPQAGAHAVALRQHLVGSLQERGDAARGETVLLGPEHHPDPGRHRIVRDAIGAHATRRRLAWRA